MKHNEIIAKEGWIFVCFFAMLSYFSYRYLGFWFSLPLIIITIFCIAFFRNPKRNFTYDYTKVVAPADGKVMYIEEVEENHYLQGPAIKITIFLNILNVHVNRIPLSGEIELVKKVPGIFLPAYKKEVTDLNVRNYVGLNSAFGKILVVQITGIIARRIVCWVKPGDKLKTGERFGLIRFGSCTEIYLPVNAKILVKPNQKVKGAETIIAEFYE